MSQVQLFGTGATSRNKVDTPTCPKCGSTDIKWLPLKNARCLRCGLLRHKKIFKENMTRRAFI